MALPQTPSLTVDCVLFDSEGRVLLIRRKNAPYKGAFALPGGFVEIGEEAETGCRREVREETGLELRGLKLLGVYSDPDRDPRGHTVSVVYLATVPAGAAPVAGDDAAAAAWVSDWRQESLAFDHAKILEDAEKMRRAQGQG